ncbi:MAG TPA: lysophospholipid acyltransferase family protein [Thermoanaerobaculia bacterium]|nr:lysophospholipid acyltransferase family protein [Thermoanaerobaculia bacterium]
MAEPKRRHRFEFAVMRVMAVLLSRSPYWLALLLGFVLAIFGHYVMRYRVQQARERIRQVFPEYPSRQVRRIAWLAWRNFIFNVVDMFRLEDVDARWIESRVVGAAAAREHVLAHCATGQGAIIASPHMGAGELAAVVMQRFGVPVFLITGRQSNALVDERLNEMRASTGIPVVQKGSALLKSVIRRLKGGEVLAFLADLRVEGGIVVDFLGAKASVAPGMALFANQTQVPILPLIITRRGWGRHHLVFHPAVVPDADAPKVEDRRRMTQQVFDIMDRAVREMPEQWFWFNKSWILDPFPEARLEHRAAKGPATEVEG